MNYARAQALWLRKETGNERIRPEHVTKVEAVFDEGYVYSSVTYEDPSFYFTVYHSDGKNVTIYPDRKAGDEHHRFDLTRMVVEGLELEQEYLNNHHAA